MSYPDDDRAEPDDEELAELADELSTVLGELRDELRAAREAREAGGAEPDPEPESGGRIQHGGGEVTIDLPSATDLLAFADERLIPGAIAVLEANIRALELLQKGIRLARPDRAGENARAVRSHAESLSRSTLERLDDTLANLQEAAGEGALPENEEARDVLQEARRLREELDEALAERQESRGAGAAEPSEASEAAGDDERGDEDGGPPDPWGLDDEPEVDVDVEGELESIKAELGKVDDEEDEEDDGSSRGANEEDGGRGDDGGEEDDPGDGVQGEDGDEDHGPEDEARADDAGEDDGRPVRGADEGDDDDGDAAAAPGDDDGGGGPELSIDESDAEDWGADERDRDAGADDGSDGEDDEDGDDPGFQFDATGSDDDASADEDESDEDEGTADDDRE